MTFFDGKVEVRAIEQDAKKTRLECDDTEVPNGMPSPETYDLSDGGGHGTCVAFVVGSAELGAARGVNIVSYRERHPGCFLKHIGILGMFNDILADVKAKGLGRKAIINLSSSKSLQFVECHPRTKNHGLIICSTVSDGDG